MCLTPKNYPGRTLILLVLLTASARAQSLGDVAKAERGRPKKAAATKIIGDEDIGRTQAADCDLQCEVSVRTAIQNGSMMKITDSHWKAHFTAGVTQLKNDDEWQTIYPQLQRQKCDKEYADLRNSPATRDLYGKLLLKVLKETNETLQIMAEGLKSLGSGPDRVEELAIKTIKVEIMSLKLDQLQRECQRPSE